MTGAYATNAAGEALPPFFIYDSSAKSEGNFRVKVDWLVGLPKVTGRYGCPTRVESDSFYAVRPRGSMDDTLLNEYIENVIVPLYPNMHKTAVFDERTGKLNQGPVILKVDAGPNATSVQQEMDALYGPFKSATYARGEQVVQEKLRVRGLARRNGERLPCAVLNLDFSDLPTIVTGTADDINSNRPFNTHFTKEKILWSWAKVGFVPFTRSCNFATTSWLIRLKLTDSTLGFGMLRFQGLFMLKGQQPRLGKWQSCLAVERPSPLVDSGITANPVLGMLE